MLKMENLENKTDAKGLVEAGKLIMYLLDTKQNLSRSQLPDADEFYKKGLERLKVVEKIQEYTPILRKYGLDEDANSLLKDYNFLMKMMGQPALNLKEKQSTQKRKESSDEC